MSYCSIDKQYNHYNKFKSCFDIETLKRIADNWNRFNKNNQIVYRSNVSHKKLWNSINDKLKDFCSDEVCWIEKLHMNNNENIKRSLLPKTPREWNYNPHTWLSNFNIEDVMFQYEKAFSEFKFLGVYPVDFRSTAYTGKCLYEETCSINMKGLLNNNTKHIGMIINLDKHNQSGSHWVALFICIDPSSECFGAYYYDSNANLPHELVRLFMQDLNSQAQTIQNDIPFKLQYNNNRHQYENSECGMFSMVFLIRWLNYLKRRDDVSMNDIVGLDIRDKDVFELRKELFRPNTIA